MTVVAEVITIKPYEKIRLNPEQLHALYAQLGHVGAEDVVCRAIEELAVRLSHCERLWRSNDLPGLRKSARSLIAIADQVGMTELSNAARAVTFAVDSNEEAAQGATLFRLIRVGERSLMAIWDLQDLSV
ncbi:MAG: hypothetical protein AB8B51_03690 [Sedimentitalea sp.]